MYKGTRHITLLKVIIGFGFIGLCMLAAGCGQVNSPSAEISDDSQISYAILNSNLIADSLETDDAADTIGLSSVVQHPVGGWKRIISSKTKNVDKQVLGNEATANISTSISGTLYVYSTTGNNVIPDAVSFNVIDTKTVHLSKANGSWAVTQISPTLVSMINSANQTVQITSVTLKGTGVSSNPITITYNDPKHIYNISDLPVFKAGSEIVVEVAVTNNSQSGLTPTLFVFNHHPNILLNAKRVRDSMFDDGISNPSHNKADSAAGDNVFSRSFTAGVAGRRLVMADIIDSGTFANSSLNGYNAVELVVPYIVAD